MKTAMVMLSGIGNTNLSVEVVQMARVCGQVDTSPNWPEEGTCPGQDRDTMPSGSEGTG